MPHKKTIEFPVCVVHVVWLMPVQHKNTFVDFRKFIQRGGIFARLTEVELFRRFQVNRELGVITWDDEIDIAPEVLYSEATNEPLPHWMEEESGMRKTA